MWQKNAITENEIICRFDLTQEDNMCLAGYSCLERVNPGLGFTSFDSLPAAILTVVEVITLEGWTDTMYAIRHANNGSVSYDIFFLMLVIFGCFFVLNLVTAS